MSMEVYIKPHTHQALHNHADHIFLIDDPLVWDTGMYMFNMNPRYTRPIVALIAAPIVALIVALIVVPLQIKHVHSNVPCKWVHYQNTIGMIMHHLVGMGLQ